MDKYLPKTPTKPDEIVKLQPPTMQNSLAEFNLPGMGGVFNSTNLAMYTYVHQSPVKFVDPDGKAAIFKFTDGTEKIAQNVAEFKDIANSAQNGSIDKITIQGHSPANGSYINFDITKPASKEGLHVDGSQAQLQDAQGNSQGNLGEVLKDKFSSNGVLDLQGCNTAAGDKSIAKAASTSLPGIAVKGSELKGVFQSPLNGLGKNVPQQWLVLPFTTPTYKNGVEQ